jgi:hypothetical protein
MNNIVKDWFGESFKKLDPLLQELHTNGGVLIGKVNLEYNSGVAGFLGRKMGAKLGLPLKGGEYDFEVNILHKEEKLFWSRKFGDNFSMTSEFEPFGRYPSGHWEETFP